MLRGSNSVCLASLFYTYTVLCTWNWQTSDRNDSSSPWSSLFFVQIRTWGHRETGNLPEITEQLRGKGRTQATENGSTVRTLVRPSCFLMANLSCPKKGFLVLTPLGLGKSYGAPLYKTCITPSVILRGSSVGAKLMSSPTLLSSHRSHMLMLFSQKSLPSMQQTQKPPPLLFLWIWWSLGSLVSPWELPWPGMDGLKWPRWVHKLRHWEGMQFPGMRVASTRRRQSELQSRLIILPLFPPLLLDSSTLSELPTWPQLR